MASSSVQITQGAGTRMGTNSYTEDAVTKHDQKVILGEPYEATYTIRFDTESIATANAHLWQIMAGASLPVYIRRIYLAQQGYTTTATWIAGLYRLTTAGTGGAAVTPSPLDPADAASGATGMLSPSSKGTEGAVLYEWPMVAAATSTTALANPAGQVLDVSFPNQGLKSPKIAAGTANGLALKVLVGGGASNTVAGFVEFVERSF